MWTLLATAILSACITSFIISNNHKRIHEQIRTSENELDRVNKAIHIIEKSLSEMNDELDKSITLKNCNK
mgnify:CR=1 FL=1